MTIDNLKIEKTEDLPFVGTMWQVTNIDTNKSLGMFPTKASAINFAKEKVEEA